MLLGVKNFVMARFICFYNCYIFNKMFKYIYYLFKTFGFQGDCLIMQSNTCSWYTSPFMMGLEVA